MLLFRMYSFYQHYSVHRYDLFLSFVKCVIPAGMRPLLYSTRDQRWQRAGHSIAYYQNHLVRSRNKRGRPLRFYTLTFTIEFPWADDVVYLSYCHPYGIRYSFICHVSCQCFIFNTEWLSSLRYLPSQGTQFVPDAQACQILNAGLSGLVGAFAVNW